MKKNNAPYLTRFVLFILCGLWLYNVAEARRLHTHADEHPSLSNGQNDSSFDYYLLALSWSPEFCNTSAGHQASKQLQCSAKLGFVVHGLWPQRNNDSYPHDCSTVESHVPADVAAIALQATPPMPAGDPGLLDHEWNKHGTCSGLEMPEYFKTIKTTAEKVKIPEPLKAPSTPLTLGGDEIVKLFTAANPGLTADMLNIEDDKQGNVSAVQICFSKALVFQACTGSHQRKSGGTFLPAH